METTNGPYKGYLNTLDTYHSSKGQYKIIYRIVLKLIFIKTDKVNEKQVCQETGSLN